MNSPVWSGVRASITVSNRAADCAGVCTSRIDLLKAFLWSKAAIVKKTGGVDHQVEARTNGGSGGRNARLIQ